MNAQHTLLLTTLPSLGCIPICDGFRPAAGEEVAITHTTAEFGEYDSGWPQDYRAIIEDEEAWAADVDGRFELGMPEPDFTTEIAFVHEWGERGCDDEAPTYQAWRWDYALRIRIEPVSSCDNDMRLPNLDVGVLQRGGASDFGFCE